MNEELKEDIFRAIRELLSAYTPPMKLNTDNAKNYELVAGKAAELDGRKRDNTFFASAVKQKDFVGFYFFPIYMHPELLNDIPEKLRKMLKGKSCFHIKKWDQQIKNEINTALSLGLKCYKEKSYL